MIAYSTIDWPFCFACLRNHCFIVSAPGYPGWVPRYISKRGAPLRPA
jgi:hypothetical protein